MPSTWSPAGHALRQARPDLTEVLRQLVVAQITSRSTTSTAYIAYAVTNAATLKDTILAIAKISRHVLRPTNGHIDSHTLGWIPIVAVVHDADAKVPSFLCPCPLQ